MLRSYSHSCARLDQRYHSITQAIWQLLPLGNEEDHNNRQAMSRSTLLPAISILFHYGIMLWLSKNMEIVTFLSKNFIIISHSHVTFLPLHYDEKRKYIWRHIQRWGITAVASSPWWDFKLIFDGTWRFLNEIFSFFKWRARRWKRKWWRIMEYYKHSLLRFLAPYFSFSFSYLFSWNDCACINCLSPE